MSLKTDRQLYYEAQLENLNLLSESGISVVLSDGEGNKTKHLQLNEDSIKALEEFFKTLIQPIKKGV